MKAIFSQPGKFLDGNRKNAMGAASLAFEDHQLDFQSVTALQITCYVFGTLDRQAISAMERSLNITAPHRRKVRRLVADMSEKKPSLREILKPMKRRDHNMAYSIFDKVCRMTSHSQRYDLSFLQKIITVGKAMGLSQGEIYRLIEKNGLAD